MTYCRKAREKKRHFIQYRVPSLTSWNTFFSPKNIISPLKFAANKICQALAFLLLIFLPWYSFGGLFLFLSLSFFCCYFSLSWQAYLYAMSAVLKLYKIYYSLESFHMLVPLIFFVLSFPWCVKTRYFPISAAFFPTRLTKTILPDPHDNKPCTMCPWINS